MKLMLFSMLLIISILTIMSTLIIMLSKKVSIDMQKATPFECGFNPMSYPRVPFSIHFFLIAVIFLVFDIEIILIMPMILTMKTSMTKFWVITSFMFVTILIWGLYHEWKNGMINWAS
uniref:NADH-ubiquinone oxidoreductase chain 3 n=1 Tax=Yanocephalus yanonis TaxID=317752 RepID=A0A343KJ50_9HEMI|nr:NADH dehydrogenase subunit 3 [Yanocephalus yanonis]ATG83155.1 NADH dehydrogenase subunit 3 [Yanocephalus yanonis]